MKKLHKPFLIFCISLGVVIGAVIAYLNPAESPLIGFLSAFLLSGLSLYALGWLWHKLGGSRLLAWTVFLTFLLRLGIGMFLFIALPVVGYDEDPTNAGYLYLDAYRRDSDAWRLAESGEPLGMAFQEEFATDQYGGLALTERRGVSRIQPGRPPPAVDPDPDLLCRRGRPAFPVAGGAQTLGGTFGQRCGLAVRALS